MENFTKSIIEWCATSFVLGVLMSDGLSHLKNKPVRLMSKRFKKSPQVRLSDCSWINGTVERLGRVLIRDLRSFISELRMDYEG